jgi:spore germination protein GerM
VVRRRLVAALAVLAVIALAVSCGVTRDSSYRPLERNEVPYNLADASTTTTEVPTTVATTVAAPPAPTTTTAPPPTVPTTAAIPTEPVRLWFVAGDHIVPVDRLMPSPVSTQAILDALVGNRLASERQDVGTLVTPGLVSEPSTAFGAVFLTIDPIFGLFDDASKHLATAQIVYTMTERPGIGRVAFQVDNKPQSWPDEDGKAIESLTRDNFATLVGS